MSDADLGQREGRCGAVLAALFDELDWPLLGASYCEGDARDFFDHERREHVLEVGLQTADELARSLPDDGPQASLYLGAALAELVPMLVESLVLERAIHWFNLPGPEFDELTRALGAVGATFAVALPVPQSVPLADAQPQPCDHLWMASVLTDPEAFPALHDELYERRGTPAATGRGDLAAERARAAQLVDCALAWSAREFLFSTSADEAGEIAARLMARGLRCVSSQPLPDSALVGDALLSARWLAE